MVYDVLVRIAEGLDVPREWIGLGYTGCEDEPAGYPGSNDAEELDEDVIRRRLLGLGSLTVLGHIAVGEPGLLPDATRRPTPLPERVGFGDVNQFITGTAQLRALDRQYGGAGVYQAIAAYARRGERLLPLASSGGAHEKLAAAIADTHMLAGWASFDAGHPDKGRTHFGRALTFCKAAKDDKVTAAVLYAIARMEIDSGAPNDGLKHLQIAQVGLRSEGRLIVANFVDADIGRAYAAMGYENEAREAVRRTVYELPGEHNAADLMGITSATQAYLSDYDNAATILHDLLSQRRETAARGAAGELVRLATVCIEMGEVDKGLAAGKRALTAVNAVPGSARTVQRLVPLRDAARKRKDSA
ncbi:MAG: hypothetical protein ACRES5_29485, partial [Pseudomonas sp.]